MKGSITRYCVCLDPATGKQLGPRCPRLTAEPKHGDFEYRDRLPGSAKARPFRRRGFATRKAAGQFRDRVYELLALGKGDTAATLRVADLIFDRTKRGGQLPPIEDIRRRLGLGRDLDRSQTVGEWLEQWFAGKRRLRESTARLYRGHLDHYLVPLLGHIPLDRLTAEQISDMFDLIIEWNQEIIAAKEEGRRPVLELDVRKRSGVVDVPTQRRVFATLRAALNAALKSPRRIDYNPCDSVEMPAEYREPRLVWSPEQVGHFLEFSEADRLGLLYRLVLLHGPRRGEAVGARWTGYDHGNKELRVLRPLLQLGGRITESRPKTRAGERTLYLDDGTNDLIKRHRTEQIKARLAWGEAYVDNDLIWCREDGSPYPPDYVSRHFGELAERAGLPKIQLHAGRHTAATLALEAGIDIKIVSERMGHSKTGITRDLYQHVRRVVHDKAAETVVELLPKREPPEEVAQ